MASQVAPPLLEANQLMVVPLGMFIWVYILVDETPWVSSFSRLRYFPVVLLR